VTEPSSTIAPLGDSALLVKFGDRIDPGLNERAHDLAAAVDGLRAADPRFGRAVPAYASVLVPFDPVAVDPDEARRVVAALLGESQPPPGPGAKGPGTLVEIPVRYGGEDGPDLGAVAAYAGSSEDDVVAMHSSATYTVGFIGFSPGFPYLLGLSEALAMPRLETPRTRIPAGSVGIGGAYTGVYPQATPGGWRLIGRTDHVLFDPSRVPPAVLSPGATVRFIPA
jgi:KipI family sensor histidine kinase inhibitor